MAKFRKKPAVIEAVQFLPDESNAEMVAHLEGCIGWRMIGVRIAIPMPGDAFAFAWPGDWVARQGLPDGKVDYWPISEDTFVSTYEPAEG